MIIPSWNGIVDPWRLKNPQSKLYTFFSPAQQSYSRIDFFLLDKRLLPTVKSCYFGEIVVLSLCFSDRVSPRQTWRMNPFLLSNEEFVSFLSDQTEHFLEINDTPDTSKGNLWEAMKAYLRGQTISYTASSNKKKSQQLHELSTMIREIDEKHASTPSENLRVLPYHRQGGGAAPKIAI